MGESSTNPLALGLRLKDPHIDGGLRSYGTTLTHAPFSALVPGFLATANNQTYGFTSEPSDVPLPPGLPRERDA